MRFVLVDFKLFTQIAEASIPTCATERAHLSRPAAIMRIKPLEEQVGVELPSRTSQGVTLTAPGDTHARGVLRQLQQLTGNRQEQASGIKGHVRVFANTTAMSAVSGPTGFAWVQAAIDGLRADCRCVGMANSAARFHLTILYSPLATLRERVLAKSRRSDHRCRHAPPDRPA